MTKSNDRRTALLTESPWKLMISLSLPAVIGMVVVGLYNLMDAVFVGQMIGATAMGAVSVAYPFTLANSGISTLIGVGSASVLSRAVGKKDKETVGKIMGNLVAMNLILSSIITVIGVGFTKQLLVLTGAEGEILEYAVRYLRIIFIGSMFVNFAQSANMVMRGEGILKRAMIITGSGAIINIILDPILITLLKGYGRGIEGAAIATILAQFITAAVTLWYFIRKSENVRIHKIRLESTLISPILSVGISAMLMQVMTLVQQTVLYNVASQHGGETWQIILAASLRIQSFSLIPIWGISQGFQPAAGTNYGAKQYERVKVLTKTFIIAATVLGLVFYLPIQLIPKTVLSWFITDAEIVSLGVSEFRILFSTYILMGLVVQTITLMQALGKASKASMIVMLRQIVLFVPLVILIPKLSGLGITGLFAAPVVVDLVVVVICMTMLVKEFTNMGKARGVSN